MMTPPKKNKRHFKEPTYKKPGEKTFVRFFKHWRTGKIMDAWEYGYKAWPLGGRA